MYNLGKALGWVDLDTSKWTAKMALVRKDFQTLGSDSASVTQKTAALGSGLVTLGSTMTKSFTLPIVAGFSAAATAAIKYESAFAGVRKTVDASEAQLAALSDTIIEMSTRMPQSATAIAGVAEAAGQLGIATQDIAEFTEVMIMLGDSTNLTSGEAATALARLANVTGMAAEDYNNLGSAIVALGNNFATTEADIASMATRLAPVAAQYGMTEQAILGISTALSSLGFEAELGGSSVSRTMNMIGIAVANGGESLRDIANVAGMTSEQFTKVFEEDATAAFTAFINGLGAVKAEGGNVASTLQGMGVEATRDIMALSALAGSSGLLAEALNVSNQAWSAGVALANEATQRYQTTESRLAMLKNQVVATGIAFGTDMLPMVEGAADGLSDLVEWFGDLDDGTKRTIVTAAALVAASGPVLSIGGKAVKLASSIISTGAKVVTSVMAHSAATGTLSKSLATELIVKNLNNKAELQRLVAHKQVTVAQIAQTAASVAAIGPTATVTAAQVANAGANASAATAISAAKAAQISLNTAMAANPMIAVMGVAVALIAVLGTLGARLNGVAKAELEAKYNGEALLETQQDLARASKETADSFSTSMDTIAGTADKAREYVTQLSSLETALKGMSAEERAASTEMAQANMILGFLNSSYEGLNLSIDANTGALNKNETAILDNIGANEELQRVQLLQDRALEINKELVNVSIEREVADRNLLAAQDALNKANRYNTSAYDMRNLQKQVEDLTAARDGFISTEKALTEELVVCTEKQKEANLAYVESEQDKTAAMTEEEAALEELSITWGVAVPEIQAQMDAGNLTAEEWAERQKKATDKANEAIKGYQTDVTNAFSLISQNTTISLEQIISNLTKNEEAMRTWSNNLNTLAALNIDSGFIAQLQAMGPAGAEQAQRLVTELTAMNGGVELELGKLAPAAQTKIDELNTAMTTGFTTATEDGAKVWKDIGFIEGPSDAIDGMAVKISLNDSLERELKATINDAKKATSNAIAAAGWEGLGASITSGITTGVNSGANALYDAIRAIIKEALRIGKAEAGSNSPAKLFKNKLGITIPQGVAVGVREGTAEVLRAMHYMVDTAASVTAPADVFTVGASSKTAVRYTDGDGVPSRAAVINNNKEFHFHGTPPLDEIETARQFRLTEQRLAEALI